MTDDGNRLRWAPNPMARLAACCLLQRPLDGRILTVWNKRAAGLCLPVGLVEDGEQPIDAAIRELREETGLEARPLDLVEVYTASHASPRARAGHVHVFVVTAPDRGSWRPRAREPGCPIAWVTHASLLAVSPFRDFYTGMFAVLGR